MAGKAKYTSNSRASAPAGRSQSVATPGTTVTESGCTLYIGTAGNLCVDLLRDPDGTKTLFKNVPVGPFNCRVKKIYGSGDGTTAADIVTVW